MASELASFNTNPVCSGVGPTDVPKNPGRIVRLVISLAVGVFIVVTSFWYLYVRQYRRRLRIRSLNPIVMGSFGSAIVIFIRAGYNFAGRQYLPCGSELALAYLFFILNLAPDNLSVASFLVKQSLRRQLAATTFGADRAKHSNLDAERKKASGITRENSLSRVPSSSVGSGAAPQQQVLDDMSSTQVHKSGWATPKRWFMGFWNHFFMFSDSTQFRPSAQIHFNRKWRFKDDPYVSPLRELSYDILTCCLFCGSCFFALGMRIGLVPRLQPGNDCTGCDMLWGDILILFGAVGWMGLLQAILIARTTEILDPLSYRRDSLVATGLSLIAWIGYILASVDPGDLMKQQQINWYLFEILAALLMHGRRCIVQIYRVSRLHKLAEQQIKLIDVLQDSRAALLFEKYLMGELASENLLFWREGIKYKTQFDRSRDFDYSQQVAKMLFRTFVAKHAQLPVNISGNLRDSIETRFKSGFVGKNVFDEALIEIYNMMQNGPFYRFVHSKEFVEYCKSGADFTVIPANVQGGSNNHTGTMSIVPITDAMSDLENVRSSNGAASPTIGGHFNVIEYVRKL